jgi:diguanylate cyclase (GGDEF)-like protein
MDRASSGRLGGDEFAIVMPLSDAEEARIAFSRTLAELQRCAAEGAWAIGFSFGVAVFAAPPSKLEEALAAADDLMYRAKRRGGGQVVIEEFPNEPEAPVSPGVESTI